MINYKVILSSNKWCIIETKTDQIIEKFDCFVRAKKKVKHFNLGGGFDGFTPSFILIKIPSV